MTIQLNNKNIFAFADTHGSHRQTVVPANTDIVVFAGDACYNGNEAQLIDFFSWFADLPVKYKLFVPGNHDLPLDLEPDFVRNMLPDPVIYLEDAGIEIEGIRFYALQARPYLPFEPAGLPAGIDVLITHGAPAGILDEDGTGCPLLRKQVGEMKPKVHIFGHSHKDGDTATIIDGTLFANVGMSYLPTRKINSVFALDSYTCESESSDFPYRLKKTFIGYYSSLWQMEAAIQGLSATDDSGRPFCYMATEYRLDATYDNQAETRRSYLGDGHLNDVCFTCEREDCMFDYRWDPISEEAHSIGDFLGRTPEQIRFKQGDLVEVMDDNRIFSGKVVSPPPSREATPPRNYREDCYCILAYDGENKTHTHLFPLSVYVFPPRSPLSDFPYNDKIFIV
jgi:predicted phosphohydrolase